jgi:ubiquinone/menaquinone biosynthesis C-methylase UbiE/DNA-binding transcriptional ArsR family regulator
MDELLAGLKAVAEISRIRILFALSQGELNVSEITQVLGQSQPRISRHLKVLAEANLISRHKEGNWVLFRLNEHGLGAALARAIVDMLPGHEAVLRDDRLRFDTIRRNRLELASTYFAANAKDWETLRSYHVQEAEVEAAMLSLAGDKPIKSLVDLGTGTGRMLTLFAGHADVLIGLDQSREMLAIARASLDRDKLKNAQVRQADIYALPLADASADLVIVHQVLHFLDDPQSALLEARRILRPQGHVLIVDFAPHEMEELREQHAHRRLGIAADQMAQWLARAGLVINRQLVLPPPALKTGKGLTVSMWLAEPTAASATPPLTAKVNALS